MCACTKDAPREVLFKVHCTGCTVESSVDGEVQREVLSGNWERRTTASTGQDLRLQVCVDAPVDYAGWIFLDGQTLTTHSVSRTTPCGEVELEMPEP